MRTPTTADLKQILVRDEHTCMMCGTRQGGPWETDRSRTKRIQVGSRFLETAAMELETDDLCALCDECDEGLKEVRRNGPPPSATLQLMMMAQHAGEAAQLELMQWLFNKFPGEARKLVK